MTRLDRKDVLVVDDEEVIRNLVAAALTRLGMHCDAAADGAEALERVAVTQYSVILVDLMMPRVDGGAFVTALRERERSSPLPPVVLMMTAFPVREHESTLAPNVQAIIQKPFDVVELAELVQDCVAAWRLHEERWANRAPQTADAAALDPAPNAPVLHLRPEGA